MNRKEKIEKMAKRAGMEITIAPAKCWVGSKGKGKWAFSEYVKGRGIYEPTGGYPSLQELENAVKAKVFKGYECL